MRTRSVARLLTLSVLAASILVPSGTATADAFDTAPAVFALQRILPAHAAQFSLVGVTRPAGGDYFRISGSAGAVRVEGTAPAVILTGVNWYLKYVAGVDVSWPGDSISRLPATLPAPPSTIEHSAVVAHRFALNDTDDGYSGAYREWAAYERQIDLLALHGVNEVFVQMGADAAYFATFQEFGYTKSELLSWIPGPAHQPWWLMQNISGFGGPVSEQLISQRAALGRRIVDRLTELGMTAVLPGYFGTVPPGFVAKNPGARVIPQGGWVGFTRPDWLDPRNALFAQVASAFYRHQRAQLGDSTMFKMDLLHEGGNAGDVPVGDAARAVMNALQTAHPGATWVLLGWQNNPRWELINAVDKAKLFIVDGLSDRYHNLNRESSWAGTPYAFGTIYNFGGHTTIGANTATWLSRFPQWRTKSGSTLKGIAYLPEGTGTNPVAFELFTELAWRDSPIDQAAWFTSYARRRYGGVDAHATAAWDLLRQGPYSMPSGSWTEAQDSLFAARPSLTVAKAAAWSPGGMRYDAGTVKRALDELLQVAPDKRTTDAYHYDLVDVARQALANRSRTLLPEIKAAYDARDLTRLRQLANEWKDDLVLLDELLATDRRFLLGPWLQAAKSWGATAAERERLEYDARSILTTWGPRSGSESGLHDYANREWAGLVEDFYLMRWTRYLDSLDTALANGTTPAPIDWFAVEDGWNRQTATYPTAPAGDAYAVAMRVRDALPSAGPITGIGGKCVDVPGGSTADGTGLILWDCHGGTNQIWSRESDGTIRNRGKCMDVRGGATTALTVVQLYQCNGTPAQQWVYRADSTLRNTKSGMCLDAEGGGSANGTPLIIWPCHTGVNQKWSLP